MVYSSNSRGKKKTAVQQRKANVADRDQAENQGPGNQVNVLSGRIRNEVRNPGKL